MKNYELMYWLGKKATLHENPKKTFLSCFLEDKMSLEDLTTHDFFSSAEFESVTFPSVTLCNDNDVRASLFNELNIKDNKNLKYIRDVIYDGTILHRHFWGH